MAAAKKTKKQGRCSSDVAAQRVRRCLEILTCHSWSDWKIKEKLGEEWGVAHSTVAKYLAQARAKLRESIEIPAEDLRAFVAARFLELSENACTIMDDGSIVGDTKTRKSALDSFAKLLGLNSPERREIEHSGTLSLGELLEEVSDGDSP